MTIEVRRKISIRRKIANKNQNYAHCVCGIINEWPWQFLHAKHITTSVNITKTANKSLEKKIHTYTRSIQNKHYDRGYYLSAANHWDLMSICYNFSFGLSLHSEHFSTFYTTLFFLAVAISCYFYSFSINRREYILRFVMLFF